MSNYFRAINEDFGSNTESKDKRCSFRVVIVVIENDNLYIEDIIKIDVNN